MILIVLVVVSIVVIAGSNPSLKGKVCLVTGATRGIGKGIALGLAEQGAVVWVTGRSLSQDDITTTDKLLGGTLYDIANDINNIGGISRYIQCDHKDDNQVINVINEITKVDGRLDILVNNAFQVPVDPSGIQDKDLLFKDFWEQPGWFWDSFNNVGLRSHYITSVYAVPLMQKTVKLNKNTPSPKPMIVHVSSFGGISYSFNVAYGVGKAGCDRMAKDMAIELTKEGIDCLSVWPGVVRTERMTHILDSGDWKKRTGLGTPSEFIETPRLSGRVIASLFNDQERSRRNGKVTVIAEAAKELGVTDINGSIPPSIRSLKFLIPSLVYGKDDNPNPFIKTLLGLVPDVLLPMSLMEGGPPPQ